MRLWGLDGHRADPVPERLDDDQIVQVREDDVVWGGYLSTHYGHFLTESASRLWAVLPSSELTDHPVVFIAPWRRPAFVRDWLRAFGVTPVELPPEVPVRFTNMRVPEPAWRLNAWISPEIRDVHLHARQRMTIPAAPRREVLWLSRSALEPGRMAYDECLLEWLLRDLVSCVCPEELSLAEQVALIENSAMVAGIIGSAFHTLLLAEAVPRCLYLCPGKVASAYVAQGQLIGTESSFLHALEFADVKSHDRARFPGGFRVMIPEVLSELAATVLPGLSDDPDVQAILRSGQKAPPEGSLRGVEREEAISLVAHNPYSVDARRKLGELFEAEGNERCAQEQFQTVADMSDCDE